MSNAVIQLIVLAGIAIFLILRLKSALGTRDGFEKPTLPAPAPGSRRIGRDFEVIEGGPDRDITDHVAEGSEAARAVAAMKQVERDFSLAEFLQGARGAYEMILMAFETGELEKIRAFLDPEVHESLAAAVAEREARGLTVTAEFVGLRDVAVHDAEFDPATATAEITLRFVGEIISAARDRDGTVVEGDPKSPRRQRDIWTFARKMGSDDPNWHLVATGE